MLINDSPQFNKFMVVFQKKLLESIKINPSNYSYGAERVPEIAGRMKIGIIHDTCFYDTPAFKKTCKHFKIRNSRTAIREFCGLEKKSSGF